MALIYVVTILFTVPLLVEALYHFILTLLYVRSKMHISSVNESRIETYSGLLSLVTPIKDEPTNVVLDYLKTVKSLDENLVEAIIIADYRSNYFEDMLRNLAPELRDNIFIVRRLNIAGGRNSAINDGIEFSSGDVVVIVDVDSKPSRDNVEEWLGCRTVCVARWRVADWGNRRISKAIAFMTELGSWLYYHVRNSLGLLIYPLGSGTAVYRGLLNSNPLLRLDVIQDDIWLGTELAKRGIRPVLLKSTLAVGAPRCMNSFMIQQRRWAFGTTDVLVRFWRNIAKSGLSIVEKIEALIYISQPIMTLLFTISVFLAPFAAYLDKPATHTFTIAVLLLGVSMLLEGFSIYVFVFESKLDRRESLFLSGRASSLSFIESIMVAPYVLFAILRLKIRYRVTPKIEGSGGVPLEVYILCAFFAAGIAISVLRGNPTTALISLLGEAASLYAITRLRC